MKNDKFFMKRGSGALVSILIPTRNRTDGLLRAIDSAYSLARYKEWLEFIVRIDDDDKETIDRISALKQNFPVLPMKIIVGPRGKGYKDLHNFYNDMASQSTGDWLMIFNDDSTFVNEGWDERLHRAIFMRPWFGSWDVCELYPKTVNSDAKQFPILRRKVYEILGHMSLSCHNDTWINQIMEFLRMAWTVEGFYIHHDKSSVKGDYSENTRLLSAGFSSEPTIHSIEAKKKSIEDAWKILSYLEFLERTSVWLDTPNKSGVWYWDCNNGAEGNFVVVDTNMRIMCGLSSKKGEVNRMEFIEFKEKGGRFTCINEYVL